jgi:hypothetical protein
MSNLSSDEVRRAVALERALIIDELKGIADVCESDGHACRCGHRKNDHAKSGRCRSVTHRDWEDDWHEISDGKMQCTCKKYVAFCIRCGTLLQQAELLEDGEHRRYFDGELEDPIESKDLTEAMKVMRALKKAERKAAEGEQR